MVPLDHEGNYYAALPDEITGPASTLGSVGSGIGAPSGSTPVTTIYVDTSTGTVYSYSNGAWIAQGGSGGTQLVVYTSGVPANPPDVTKPALAYDPNGIQPILGWGTASQTWGAS